MYGAIIVIFFFAFVIVLGTEIGHAIQKKYFYNDVVLASQIYPSIYETESQTHTCKGIFYTNQWHYRGVCSLAFSDRFIFFEVFNRQKTFISSPVKMQIPIEKLVPVGIKKYSLIARYSMGIPHDSFFCFSILDTPIFLCIPCCDCPVALRKSVSTDVLFPQNAEPNDAPDQN